MNKVTTIQTDEIRFASRTLETILLTNEDKKDKVVYLYNYDGTHFRIFENIFEVSNFLCNKPFILLKEYKNEIYVNKFLENYKFVGQ